MRISSFSFTVFGLLTVANHNTLAIGTASNIKARRVLVVAGNFSIDDELVNIAQYDIATKE